jgi:Flp pilus assembly protein TadG
MRSKLENQNGQSIVEFALIAFLLFLVIFGIIEIGLLLFNQQIVTNAAREGTRIGIVSRPIPIGGLDYKVHKAAIITAATNYAESSIVSFGAKSFLVTPTLKSGLDYCKEFQDVLTVEVKYDYSFLLLPFAKKTLSSKAIMICE